MDKREPYRFGIYAGLIALTAIAALFTFISISSYMPDLVTASVLTVAVILSAFATRVLPANERHRRRFEAVAVFVVCFVLSAVLYPIQPPRAMARATHCLSNIKQIAIGTILYASDYDEKLPKADVWQDSIVEYIKSKDIYKCLVGTSPESYAFNSTVSGRDSTKIESPDRAVMEFEADAHAHNAHGGPEWFATRHGEKGNLAFVDAHARRFDRLTAMKLIWFPK